MSDKHIPVDHLNTELRRIGRGLDGAAILCQAWKDGEYGLQVAWPDGHCAFVGMGPVASAVVESQLDGRRH